MNFREIGDTNGFEYVEGTHAIVDLFSKTILHSLRKFTTYQVNKTTFETPNKICADFSYCFQL